VVLVWQWRDSGGYDDHEPCRGVTAGEEDGFDFQGSLV
jgi:hypothetical protein